MRIIKRKFTVYRYGGRLMDALVGLIDQICPPDRAAFLSRLNGSSLSPLCLWFARRSLADLVR
jgi:hypothetical protein